MVRDLDLGDEQRDQCCSLRVGGRVVGRTEVLEGERCGLEEGGAEATQIRKVIVGERERSG
jgi:hypothetical protein